MQIPPIDTYILYSHIPSLCTYMYVYSIRSFLHVCNEKRHELLQNFIKIYSRRARAYARTHHKTFVHNSVAEINALLIYPRHMTRHKFSAPIHFFLFFPLIFFYVIEKNCVINFMYANNKIVKI